MWVRSERRHRWGALLMLAALIALAGGSAVAAAAGANRTDTAFDRMLAAIRQPNLEIAADGDLDPLLLDRAAAIDGVTGLTELALMLVAPEGYDNYFAIAIVESRGDSPRFLRVDGGGVDDFESFAADVVLVDETMRDALGKTTGDSVQINSLSPEQAGEYFESNAFTGSPGGPAFTVRIADVVRPAESISDSPDPRIVFSPSFYAEHRDDIVSCRCVVLLSVRPDRLQSVQEELGAIYPDADIHPTEDLKSRLTETVALQQKAWWMIALAAGLAGLAAVALAMLGLMRSIVGSDDARRALGMTQGERRWARFLVLMPAAAIGTAGAAAVAYLLSPLAPVGIAALAEPEPGLRWNSGVIWPGLAAVLASSLAVASMTAVLVRRRPQRLRDGIDAIGVTPSLGRRLAFGPGRAAVFGVFLAVAGLAGALTLQRSIERVLATPAAYGADFDASVFVGNGQDRQQVAAQFDDDNDIAAVGLVWVEQGGADNQGVQVDGSGGQVFLRANAIESVKGTVSVGQTKGRPPQMANEVAVGQAAMDELDAQVGDALTVTGSAGSVTLTITGDALDPSSDDSGQGFVMTRDGLDALFPPAIDGVVVRFAAGADHDAVISRYSDIGLQVVSPPSEVGNLGRLGGLPLRAGQLLALLGFVALANAFVQTVRRSGRQLATYRALGFTNAQVVVAHLWQGGITALIGAGVGGLVGVVAGRAITRTLVIDVGAIPTTVLPPMIWAVVGACLAVSLTAGLVAGGFALRRRPGSVLRAE